MADVNQGDIVRIAVRAEIQGTEDHVNVYDMVKTDASGQDAASALSDLEDWVELVYLILRAIQTTALIYRELTAYNTTQQTVLGAVTITTPSSGTRVEDDIPPGNAAMISFPTTVGKVIGRKYFGGLGKGTIDPDGSLTASIITTLISTANAIRAPFVGTTGEWHYGVVRSLTGQHLIPTASVIVDTVSYQRRRRTGRGS